MKQKMLTAGGVPAAQLHTQKNAGFSRHRVLIVMMLMALMMKPDVGWGQCGPNRIQNPNFQMGPPCTLLNNNGSSSFEDGCVEGWFRAAITPHHAIENPNAAGDYLCDIFNIPWIPYDGSEFTCMGGYEGIFQNQSILQNPYLSFEFSLDVAGLECELTLPGNTMEILISKDLTDQIPFFYTFKLSKTVFVSS